MKRRISASTKDTAYGWLLLLPVVLCIVLVKWHPIISGIVRSFYSTTGYEVNEFVENLDIDSTPSVTDELTSADEIADDDETDAELF